MFRLDKESFTHFVAHQSQFLNQSWSFYKVFSIPMSFFPPRMACIYQVLEHSLSQTSPEEDLRWYSLHYGVDMQYNWPEYEVGVRARC